jgi:hypothetical protein
MIIQRTLRSIHLNVSRLFPHAERSLTPAIWLDIFTVCMTVRVRNSHHRNIGSVGLQLNSSRWSRDLELKQPIFYNPSHRYLTPIAFLEMGWISSVFGTDKSADPLGKLDPQLREFLQKESPVKYTPNQPSTTNTTSAPTQQNDDPSIAPSEAQPTAVPSASLYQDGRYAHLWKGYTPLAQIEAETATDHDKLMGVLESFKERKAVIGKAALENCAEYQEEWVHCMKHGTWEDQLQMCRHQVRRFERCYAMQSVRAWF